MIQCKIETENEKLKKENKELWERYYELQRALIDKECIELEHIKLKWDMPKWFWFFKWLYKGDIYHLINNERELEIWISSRWGRSWEI